MAAHSELQRRKVEATGTGLGPCGDTQGDYAAWNMSSGVHDWKHAEQLVRIIAELLDRYDAAGYTGAAVRGIRRFRLLLIARPQFLPPRISRRRSASRTCRGPPGPSTAAWGTC